MLCQELAKEESSCGETFSTLPILFIFLFSGSPAQATPLIRLLGTLCQTDASATRIPSSVVRDSVAKLESAPIHLQEGANAIKLVVVGGTFTGAVMAIRLHQVLYCDSVILQA